MRGTTLAILTIFLCLIFVRTAFSEATIEAPSEVNAGAEFKVKWTGPDNKQDFITIVEADTEEKKYGSYKYTKKGEALTLRAPDKPGSYEIRYLDGQTRDTVGRVSITVLETPATVEAPPEVEAGSEFKVIWTGPDNKRDFITIIEADAEEGKYGKYTYTNRSKEDRDGRSYLTLKAPDTAGSYEIRYLSGQKYYTLARVPITVTSAEASLTAPPEAAAGSELKVLWTGPDNRQDFITIIEADAEEGKYGNYTYTNRSKEDRDGNAYINIKVPEKAGSYEVRYLTAQTRKTLARIPLTVTATEASLEVPPEVGAGSEFKVYWQGPDNERDFITIVPADAEEKTYKGYKYITRGKEDREGRVYLTLTAPDDEGAYEVRYLTGQEYNTLARAAVTVTAVTATLDAPEQVIANEKFDVSWTGPGNEADYIGVYESAEADAKYKGYAYTRRGNPVKIQAPMTPGTYELRYVTGQSRKILAARSIEVLKSNEPGMLKVVSGGTVAGSGSGIGAVELILDASGSMLKKLNGTPRIDIAKEAVITLVNDSLDSGTPFALRVFGHKEADSCRTDLEVPLQPLDKAAVVSNVKSINAMNLAKTPIGKSLGLVSEDLAGVEGKTIIVLVTDGEETCDGDPKQAIQSLKDSGYDVRVNIVGFAIDELMLKETFREWAQAGNGSYFDATNAEELADSIQKAIEVPYEVLDSEDGVVATGVINGGGVSVPAGTYTVRVMVSPPRTIDDVVIEPEAEKEISLD